MMLYYMTQLSSQSLSKAGCLFYIHIIISLDNTGSDAEGDLNGNINVIILMKFSSPAALEVVIMKVENFNIMIFVFQW